MATAKKTNTKTDAKKTVTTPSAVTPSTPKTQKIRMKSLYISNDLILRPQMEYEIDGKLAQAMIKNGDAEVC